MALLGFTMFKDKILNGSKKQTIRKMRKKPIKLGECLYLYWKLRTKQCEKLGDAKCVEVFPIHISSSAILLENQRLSFSELETLARFDGFSSFSDFIETFKKMHRIDSDPSFFQVIRWSYLDRPQDRLDRQRMEMRG